MSNNNPKHILDRIHFYENFYGEANKWDSDQKKDVGEILNLSELQLNEYIKKLEFQKTARLDLLSNPIDLTQEEENRLFKSIANPNPIIPAKSRRKLTKKTKKIGGRNSRKQKRMRRTKK